MLDERPRTAGADHEIGAAVRKKRRLYIGILASVACLIPGPLQSVVAAASAKASIRLAQRVEVHVTVASRIIAEPVSQVRLLIQVSPADALPEHSFIRIRGLPPTVSLSEGHSIAPGSWAVPLFGLPTLKANVPAGVSGQSEIVITLVKVDGTVLAEARSALVVGAAAPMIAPAEKAPPNKRESPLTPPTPSPTGKRDGGSQPTPRPPELSSEERERALTYLKKGDEQLAQGNFGTARLFYERAANAGLPQGAMALAGTYDATELERLNVRGIQPDAKEARRWYERARQLGATDTNKRLERLGAH